MKLIHLGGEKCVTGSCHLLQAAGLNILVDCGLTQGHDAATPMSSWPIAPADIDYLFLTHAHIDHIGRVPELIRNGFNGQILTSHGTKALLRPMLEDALSFSNLPRHEADKILATIDELSWGFEYLEPFDLKSGVRFELGRAGHILGSCFIRFEWGDTPYSAVFSGDLGARRAPLLPDPDIPEPCDLLVLESTYGDRCHENRTERIRRLGESLSHSLADGGKVFIPAFALGRIQELLFEMDRLFSDAEWQRAFPLLNRKEPIPVFVDSPLGLKITETYASLSEFWDREAKGLLYKGDNPIDFEHLYAVRTHGDHLQLLDAPGPAVIIAGSGMCSGGRIVNHLQNGLPDPRNDVFFVGYQAAGTPGRDIINYARRPGGYVVLDGEQVPIRAKVQVLSGYSAHADQQELLEWAKAVRPAKVKLVHGEQQARQALVKLGGWDRENTT